MTESFECAWQSLRDAPRARVDFGDGHVLDRTLGGNVLTWICLPDGRAVDILPGLVDAATWRFLLESSLNACKAVLADPDPVARARTLAEAGAAGWARYVPEAWAEADLSELPSTIFETTWPGGSGLSASFVSKGLVETPILEATGIVARAHSSPVVTGLSGALDRRVADPLLADARDVTTRLKPLRIGTPKGVFGRR